MSGADESATVAGAAGLQAAIEQARRKLDEARRSHRTVPASVHVIRAAVLTAAVALPPLVVLVAYESARAFPCTTYARVKVIAVWAVVAWVATAVGWTWLRSRRGRQGVQKDPHG